MGEPSLGAVFAALSDPSRRRVVVQLCRDPDDREHACGSFDLPVSKATRTHHFRILREAGLIEQRHHGNGSAVRLLRAQVDGRWPGLLALVLADEGPGPEPGTDHDPA